MLYGCEKEFGGTFFDKFEDVKSIKHVTIPLKENNFFSRVSNIYINEDKLILSDESEEFYFSIYDLRKRAIVSKTGRKGQGPNEIVGLPQSVSVMNRNNFFFYEIERKKIFDVKISESNNSLLTERKINIKGKYFEIQPLSNNRYIAVGLIEEGRYALINSLGDEISYHFDYPAFKGDEKFSNFHKAMAFQGRLLSRPDGNRFVFTATTSELLEILKINKDNSIVKVYDFKGVFADFIPEGDGKNTISAAIKRTSKVCFINSCCTNRYIYILYSGRIIENNFLNAFKGNIVYVIDWNGNPVARYNLDIDVKCIAVSADDKTLYAIAEQDDTNLVKFKLNH